MRLITIADATSAGHSDEVHPRAIVALTDGQPVEVGSCYPDMGLAEPLSERYDLDREALAATSCAHRGKSEAVAPRNSDRQLHGRVTIQAVATTTPGGRLPMSGCDRGAPGAMIETDLAVRAATHRNRTDAVSRL